MNRAETVAHTLFKGATTLGRWPLSLKVGAFFAVWGLTSCLYAAVPMADGHRLSWLQATYCALGAFAIGPAVLPPAPRSALGGALWAMLFVSPMLTISAVADGLQLLLRSPALVTRRLKGHLIVCGHGEHGRRIVEAATKRMPKLSVVVVDKEDRVPGAAAAHGFGHHLFLQGDIRDPEVLRAAGVENASACVFASGDPWVNLNGAQVANTLSKQTQILALVDTAPLLEGFAAALALAPDTLVDQFAAAAAGISRATDAEHGFRAATAAENGFRAAVVGFGRFGRAALSQLLRQPNLPAHVTVVDRVSYAAPIARLLGQDAAPKSTVQVDSVAADATAWCANLDAHTQLDVVIITISNPVVALHCAALVRKANVDTRIILRSVPPARATPNASAEAPPAGGPDETALVWGLDVSGACAEDVTRRLKTLHGAG